MLAMDPATKAERIAVLHEEIEFIQSRQRTVLATGEPEQCRQKRTYYCRQERLEEIRRELSELQWRSNYLDTFVYRLTAVVGAQ
jgi:hypothetical protein